MRGLFAAVTAALVCAGPVQAAQRVSLPSPVAPLSAAPPLAGGARTTGENVRHSVSASTTVDVSIDQAGTPFAVTAVQHLDVRGIGDYFFTIGAPVLTVRASSSSAGVPGMRSGSIIWEGFNPGERTLGARTTLDPAQVVAALPLRVAVNGKTVSLVNTTSVSVETFAASAPRAPLVAYLALLRAEVSQGRTPLQTSVPIASTPSSEHITVAAPLHVTGTIGSKHIDLMLTGRAHIHGPGRIDLRVDPVEQVDEVTASSGRALLHEAIRETLLLARANQYEEFLGNPDPAGLSRTTYVYRTSSPPRAAPIASVGHHRRTWIETALVIAAVAAALVAGAAWWARS